MYEAIIFTMKDGLPVASRMLRFSAGWHRSEVVAHCKFMFGKGASITVRARRCAGASL